MNGRTLRLFVATNEAIEMGVLGVLEDKRGMVRVYVGSRFKGGDVRAFRAFGMRRWFLRRWLEGNDGPRTSRSRQRVSGLRRRPRQTPQRRLRRVRHEGFPGRLWSRFRWFDPDRIRAVRFHAVAGGECLSLQVVVEACNGIPFLAVPGDDAANDVSNGQRNPEGCEWIFGNERDELVVGLFYLTNDSDGRVSVRGCGFLRIFQHRATIEQRAGQDEWARVARLRKSGLS